MNDQCCRPAAHTAPQIPADEADRFRLFAAWAKALGHPVRVRIVAFLLGREGCMCGDIVEHIDLAQSTVSQHLKILKEAGVIAGTIDGPRMCYCVNPAVVRSLAEGLLALLASTPDLISQENHS